MKVSNVRNITQRIFYLLTILLLLGSVVPQNTLAFDYELIQTYGEWNVALNDNQHLNQPVLLSVDQKYIIINNYGNGRITLLNRSSLQLINHLTEYTFRNGTNITIGAVTAATVFHNKIIVYDYDYQTLFVLELNGTVDKTFYWPATTGDKSFWVSRFAVVNDAYLYFYTNANDTSSEYWNITTFDETLTKLSSISLVNLIPELSSMSFPILYNFQSLTNGTIFVYIYSGDHSVSCMLSYNYASDYWSYNIFSLNFFPVDPLYYSDSMDVFYYSFGTVRLYNLSGEKIGEIKQLPNDKALTGVNNAIAYQNIIYAADSEHHVLVAVKITDLTPAETNTSTNTTTENGKGFFYYVAYILWSIFFNLYVIGGILILIIILIGRRILRIKKQRRRQKELEM